MRPIEHEIQTPVTPPTAADMETHGAPMIPTVGKAHPPFGFCYPLGAMPIGEAFATFPDFDRLFLAYSTNSPLLRDDWRLPGYPLIRATYSSYPEYTPRQQPGIRTQRQGGTRWQLDVLIVPKHKRESLQPLIIEQGLPMLYAWMTGPNAPQPDERRKSVELWWFEDTGTIKLHEPGSNRTET